MQIIDADITNIYKFEHTLILKVDGVPKNLIGQKYSSVFGKHVKHNNRMYFIKSVYTKTQPYSPSLFEQGDIIEFMVEEVIQ